MIDQHLNETQKDNVDHSGGASGAVKPSRRTPRRKKFTGQKEDEAHKESAGEGRAVPNAKTMEPQPAPQNTADHKNIDDHQWIVSGADQTIAGPKTNTSASDPQKFPKGKRAATFGSKPIYAVPRATKGSHVDVETHSSYAPLIDEPGQPCRETQSGDARFVDPLIMQIVETWRQRQDMVRAMGKLTLQCKAILRRLCAGDKTEANKVYRSIGNGMDHALAQSGHMAVAPLLAARQPLEASRKAYEKKLIALAKDLPIAHMVDETVGLGLPGLAAIIGECGDLSAYKSVAAVWKRCGLAVISGGRQRRVTGEAALEHGYSPSRRSVIWTLTDSLFKAQSAGMKDGAAPGPYRALYDELKALELAKDLTAGHAHNRALRRVSKKLLCDLTVAWRAKIE